MDLTWKEYAMQVEIRARKIEVDETLRAHVDRRLRFVSMTMKLEGSLPISDRADGGTQRVDACLLGIREFTQYSDGG